MTQDPKAPPSVRIRPATLDDAEAVCRVQQRNGGGERDAASWRQSWEAYPFEGEFAGVAVGWVLETQAGEVVGCLDNIHMLYELSGKRLKAGIASGWAVDAAYRARSLHLMTAFFRQQGTDLQINGSANPTTAAVLTAMKVSRIPIPDYGVPCFWALRHSAFAKSALSKRGIPVAGVLAWPVGLLLSIWDAVRGSGRGRPDIAISRATEFDSRFDALGQRILRGPACLRAVRSRDVLRWRFRDEIREGRIAIITAENRGELAGYAILLRRSDGELGMELCDVADIQAAGDDPAIMRSLLLGSIRAARADGMDALKFVSGTPSKRAPANALKPYSYALQYWQQYYKAASPELVAALSTADRWDFSRFDTF